MGGAEDDLWLPLESVMIAIVPQGCLIGHDRRPAAFAVYLYLCRHACGHWNWSVRCSHQAIASATGLSRSAVQAALSHLARRQLVASSRGVGPAVQGGSCPCRRARW
jgi:hypothetical protein